MRIAIIAASLCLSMTGPCFAQNSASAVTRIEMQIPPQALGNALQQFAKLRHMQVLFITADVKDLRTSGVSGNLTADEALTRLLRGTGLKYLYVDSNAVTILPVRSDKASGSSRQNHNWKSDHESSHSKTTTDPPLMAQMNGEKNQNTERHTDSASSSQSTDKLQEVIVTAQEYRQPAFDVPISLVVIGAHQIQQEHITNLNDLQYYVPGLRVEGGGAQQRIIIRGVGNDIGNGAYVSEYINEADVTGSGYSGAVGFGGTALETYDLARVEVLRGPQGTLYGNSAMGGTIRLITNQPVLNKFQMTANIELPFTQDGAPSQDVEAMINTPIAHRFALRVAGQFSHNGGWIDEPQGNLKNINQDNLTDMRVEGLWKPIPKLNVRLMQIIHRESYGLSLGENANGDFTPLFNTSYVPNGQKRFGVSNVTMTYHFHSVRILSSSTYLNSHQILYNLNENEVGIVGLIERNLWDSQDKFTEELRASSTGGGPWRWLMGGFYDHDRSNTANGFEYAGLYSLPATLSSLSSALQVTPLSPFSQGSDSWAVFGNTSYVLAKRLTVGIGLRYYQDLETANGDGYTVCPCKATFTSTSPRAFVEYRVTRNVNAYISATKGFRTGGFNPFVAHPYSPESLWSYELGTKIRIPDDQLTANADVYLSNYSNYLVFAIIPALSPIFGEIYNVGNARIKGVEADVEWRPNRNWLMTASGEYVDARIVSVVSSALQASYSVGDRLPMSSKYQFTASVERDFHWRHRPGYVRVDFSELSPQVDYQPLEYSDLIRMLGAEAGIHWTKELSFGVFARNLLNDRGVLDPFRLLGVASRARPRTYGVDFSIAMGGR